MNRNNTYDDRVRNFQNFDGKNFGDILDEKLIKNQDLEEQKKIIDEQRRSLLRAILEPAAIERLNRIGLVKPEKVVHIEDYILRTARASGFSAHMKMKEEDLVNILSRMNELMEKSDSKIRICRKGIFDDDDEFEY